MAMINEPNLAALAGVVKVGDFHINRMGFGAMRITGEGIWGEPADPSAAKQLLQAAVQMGINFIDTADAYGPEVSEQLIAEALYPYEGIIIATKGGLTRSGPGQWEPDCRPSHLKAACQASLDRLGIKRIDVYQLHTVDPAVPFKDSYQAMLDLQAEGKVRHIGLSNIEPEHFAEAMSMGPFVSVQNNYNLFNREHEDVLALCVKNNIAFIPYFPIGGGQTDLQQKVVVDIARDHNATVHQIALAWLLQQASVMLPIPGTASAEHLAQNVAAAAISLSAAEVAALDTLA